MLDTILGQLYWDNGKCNGNYRGYRDYNIAFIWVAVKIMVLFWVP